MDNTNTATADTRLTIEKVGKVWRARYDGVTLCSCSTRRSTVANANYLMRHLQPEVWRALVRAEKAA